MTKIELYTKLKNEGKLRHYDKTLEYNTDEFLIEHAILWGSDDDKTELFQLFDFEKIKDVWNLRVVTDIRYVELNEDMAVKWFNIEEPEKYVAETSIKYSRYEMFKRMAEYPNFNMETDVYCSMFLEKENN
jgi:hypothetical protein